MSQVQGTLRGFLSNRRQALALTALVLAAVAAHADALRYGFVGWDDFRFFVDNPLFQGSVWRYVAAALTRPQFEAYHPLHLLSYLPDRLFWPHHPAGFHALNLAVFAVDVVLLFRLASRHAVAPAAALAVALFAVHPLTVEPVAWISARKDLLAGAFFTGVLLVEDVRPPEDARPSLRGLLLAACAFLSKTSTLCLPLVAWCWLVWARRLPPRRAARRAAPYAILAAVPAALVALLWKGHQMIGERPVPVAVDVPSTVAAYARRVVWPADLAAVYPAQMPASQISAAVVALLALAAAVSWRRLPRAARLALGSFAAALLPVANLVPVHLRFADRYAFVALQTLVVPVAIALERSLASRRARVAAACASLVAALAMIPTTLQLTKTWATSLALWKRAVDVHPDAVLARIYLGQTLAELHDWPAALAQYQAALRLLPSNAYAYGGLLFVYAGRAEEQGRLPRGTAQRWQAAFADAQHRAPELDALLATVSRAGCRECADVLLLLRLRRWPRPDAVLLTGARAALDQGRIDAALILLDAAADKSDARWQSLWDEAARDAPH